MPEDLSALIRNLSQLTSETETVEFKDSYNEPEMIGRDISALANSAALHNEQCGYMVWGIDDTTHNIIGTNFNPYTAKGQGKRGKASRNFYSVSNRRSQKMPISGSIKSI